MTWPVSRTKAANCALVTAQASIRNGETVTRRAGPSPSPEEPIGSSVPMTNSPAGTATMAPRARGRRFLGRVGDGANVAAAPPPGRLGPQHGEPEGACFTVTIPCFQRQLTPPGSSSVDSPMKVVPKRRLS